VEISSQAYTSNTCANLSKSIQPWSEITLLHKADGRNNSTLKALARHAQGHSLEPSQEESVQSICLVVGETVGRGRDDGARGFEVGRVHFPGVHFGGGRCDTPVSLRVSSLSKPKPLSHVNQMKG
jgi:hypothetical protein